MDWISPENPNEKIRVNPLEGSGTVIFPLNQGDLVNNEINDDINSIDDNKGGLISDSNSVRVQYPPKKYQKLPWASLSLKPT